MSSAPAAGLGLVLALGVVSPAAGQPPPPAAAAAPDSVPAAAPDSVPAAPADSVALPEPPPPFRPDPTLSALSTFRLDRSVDVERVAFGDPDDPFEPLGTQTMGDLLRLDPATRTRELTQGPTVETYELGGGGSARSGFLLGGHDLRVPNTSGPHTHEVMLSEIAGYRVLRGGGAALYGPTAITGGVVAIPRFPMTDEPLLSRLVAEEGVDDYQRGGFQAERRLGANAAFFLSAESRRVEGFVPAGKEVDRAFTGSVRSRLSERTQVWVRYREYSGDGRFGGYDDGEVGTILTKRRELAVDLYRSLGADRGLLVELARLGARLDNLGGGASALTRTIDAPIGRVTADLPDVAGFETVARAEFGRWKIDRQELDSVDRWTRAAAALRVTRRAGASLATATIRWDGEEDRTGALQLRGEAELAAGPARLFGVASRNVAFAERGADEAGVNEVTNTAELGARLELRSLRVRLAAFGTRIHSMRADPTFAMIRARVPVLAAPVGAGEIAGASLGLGTERFRVPGVRFLGDWSIRTSVTAMSAENVATGERLPGRARFTWTGEGLLERRFFADELLARVRGRLTHNADRVDDAGEEVSDLWMTDVLLEGELGDAAFFYRFHDLLEEAVEVEPGIRFPGFSRTYGIAWRFVG